MIRWVNTRIAVAIHDDAVRVFGGSFGLRDEGLLESALVRPQTHLGYTPEASVAELAGIYIDAITLNHPFVDGNKRTAFGVGLVFCELNGYSIDLPELEVVALMNGLAAHEITTEELQRRLSEAIHASSFRLF